MEFIPNRVMIEREALDYPLGRSLYDYFKSQPVELAIIGSHNRVGGIPGKTPQEKYREAKKTLVLGVRKNLTFQTCKPSAHFQLPLTTSCPGKCEYCYLISSLPEKPYIRAYVNIDEILDRAGNYIDQRKPEVTIFEGSATSDPIPVERYTGALARAITFFAGQKYGRFRFVTKFTDVDSLLGISHNDHTVCRFSLNTPAVIKKFEHGTPSLEERLEAAQKMAAANYPLGFMIAPVIVYEGWQDDYIKLLEFVKARCNNIEKLSFEFVTHRFTERARKKIAEIFPATTLPMGNEDRKFKFGQFGYGKYVYKDDLMGKIKSILTAKVMELFPASHIEYIV
ncbi:MAG TPA: spore photoproduct lyase [Desulfotomaculum sp.]|nr:spore photoproduct lyase [Desulfotomaculum sp.]